MSDLGIAIIAGTVFLVVTLHWYRPFRDDDGKKLVKDDVEGPGDILVHFRAAGIPAASLQFKKDKMGWWQAEIEHRGRKFSLNYHHGELECAEAGGTALILPEGACRVCTVFQQVGMLCFEIGRLTKEAPIQPPVAGATHL